MCCNRVAYVVFNDKGTKFLNSKPFYQETILKTCYEVSEEVVVRVEIEARQRRGNGGGKMKRRRRKSVIC